MYESSSIHAAARNGNATEVARLLQADATLIHATNLREDTPLHVASTVEVAQLLVEYGARLDAPDCRGRVPLHNATADNRLDVVQFLLESGANADAEQDIGDTPLCCARSAAVAQLLIDHAATIEPKHDGWTPLMRAASSGYTEVVELLLRLGAKTNACHPCDGSPLILALNWGRLGAARMLLEAGSDVNVTEGCTGDTPLHKAAELGEPDRADRLAKTETLTPTEMVLMVVSHGADLCARNYKGETPLHIARRVKASEIEAVLRRCAESLPDAFPPEPGPPHSERICRHPSHLEAVTTVLYGGLARWSLDGAPRLLARAQTSLPHFRHIAVSPEGNQVAVAYADIIEFRRWDDLTLVSQITIPECTAVGAIAFSPNGRWLAVNVDKEHIYLIDWVTGITVAKVIDAGRASWMSCDPTSRLLACVGFIEGNRVCVYRLKGDVPLLELAWHDEDEADTGNDDADTYWLPLFAVHAALSPDARWLAYFGTDEYPPPDRLGQLVLYSLESGKLQWHRPINAEIIGEERFSWRDYFDQWNHTEVLFLSDTEIVCGATGGTLLFFDVATGTLNRRLYMDTEEDVLSLALDRETSTLWAVLSNGKIVSVSIHEK